MKYATLKLDPKTPEDEDRVKALMIASQFIEGYTLYMMTNHIPYDAGLRALIGLTAVAPGTPEAADVMRSAFADAGALFTDGVITADSAEDERGTALLSFVGFKDVAAIMGATKQ